MGDKSFQASGSPRLRPIGVGVWDAEGRLPLCRASSPVPGSPGPGCMNCRRQTPPCKAVGSPRPRLTHRSRSMGCGRQTAALQDGQLPVPGSPGPGYMNCRRQTLPARRLVPHFPPAHRSRSMGCGRQTATYRAVSSQYKRSAGDRVLRREVDTNPLKNGRYQAIDSDTFAFAAFRRAFSSASRFFLFFLPSFV